MDFSFGSLTLNRTDPAHIGKGPLDGSSNVSSAPKKQGTFETYLLDAVSEMNDQQLAVSKLQEQVITDPDSVEIHEVTTAMAKAKMSMNLAQTVIERLVSGWNEISQTR